MPREPKPKAVPEEMPRTEEDLDTIMTAVEVHKIEGARIGEAVRAAEIDPSEALLRASDRDARLYDILDQMAFEREEEFVGGDEQLKERLKKDE